jgi:hypothetical protein
VLPRRRAYNLEPRDLRCFAVAVRRPSWHGIQTSGPRGGIPVECRAGSADGFRVRLSLSSTSLTP